MISILMTIYNEPLPWIKQAIDSTIKSAQFIDNQKIEMVIVLDNPGYSDIIELRSFLDTTRTAVPVLLIENEKNLGIVESLNRALASAQGTYIARMDADDISFENRLEKEWNFLNKNSLDMVAAQVSFIDEHESHLYSLEKYRDLLGRDLVKVEALTNVFWHPTWLMSRAVVDELNGYRNVPSAEDYDFVVRAIKSGFKLGLMGEVLLFKRVSSNNISEYDVLQQKKSARWVQKSLRRKYSESDVNTVPRVSDDVKKDYLRMQIRYKRITSTKARFAYLLLHNWGISTLIDIFKEKVAKKILMR